MSFEYDPVEHNKMDFIESLDLCEKKGMFVKITSDSPDCVICLSERNDLKSGNEVRIKFDEKRIHLFDKETELSIMSRRKK